ncbi:13920_t:CDS:2 [Ambispora leptoticha]|uniref:13920_t:CDS:1 n=1 Tax=Ambispora leptoticha TaxID=144679 RepID=A0A9N8ZGF7_9GLOM|nr:13920_t:CDS:2 [Ambispora leptoticha]
MSSGDQQRQEEWIREQLELKAQLIESDDFDFEKLINQVDGSCSFRGLDFVGGVDISFVQENEEDAVASLVVLKFPELEVIYEDFKSVKLKLPYIPGFLAFREVKPLVDLISTLKTTRPEIYPKVIFVDGNGILHPRRFGLACHLGVLVNVPTIGVGKNFLQINDDGDQLTMTHVKEQCKVLLGKGGDVYYLRGDSGQYWGAAVRSLDNTTNPIFVSVGHRISLDTAIQVVLKCCRYRIPEPTRQADIRSREFIRTLS